MRREEPQTIYKEGGLVCSHKTLFRKMGSERLGHSLPISELEETISKFLISRKQIKGGLKPNVKNQNKHVNPNNIERRKALSFQNEEVWNNLYIWCTFILNKSIKTHKIKKKQFKRKHLQHHMAGKI